MFIAIIIYMPPRSGVYIVIGNYLRMHFIGGVCPPIPGMGVIYLTAYTYIAKNTYTGTHYPLVPVSPLCYTFSIMPRPKSYTPEQHSLVLNLRAKGTPITAIMTLTGLSHGTVQRIIENDKK